MPPVDEDQPKSAATAEPEVVEELDADLLASDGTPPLPEGAGGVLQAALAEARAARAEGHEAQQIAFYEQELAAIVKEPDKARAALYQHEIGELLEASGDEGAAVKAYARALQADATLKPNLWAIRRVFQRRALWPNLLKLLDAEIRFARNDPEKAELLVEKGQLLEDRLDDPAGARDCFEKACVTSPSSVAAWMSLEKMFARDNDLGGLARVYRGLATATEEPGRKVALLLDLARLQASISDGSVDAAIALCKEALAVGVDGERALDELERQAEAGGRTDELIAALDARVARLREIPETAVAERLAATERVVTCRRHQAQLALTVGDPARAWVFLEEGLKAAPSEPLLVRELGQLAESLGRWDELATVLARRIAALPAGSTALAGLMLDRAAALRRAGKLSEAEGCEADVARETPAHLGLAIAREREALRAGDWERLALGYLAEAELAASTATPSGTPDPVWAATACTQAAMLLAERVGRDADAQAALARALSLVPGFRLAVDALDRLLARTGRHAERAALLDKELDDAAARGDQARAARVGDSLLALRENELGDAAGAAAVARRLVALSPDDVRARLRLCELDRAAAKWSELADDLASLAQSQSLSPALSDDRKVELLLERADVLLHRLSDDTGAAEAYKQVLALRPGEARAAEAFEEISRRRAHQSGSRERPSAEPWDDLAAALRREVDATLNPARQVSALLKLGEIHERERLRFDDAAQAYRDLLDRAPGNAAALRGLARSYAALGDDARRAAVLDEEVAAIADPDGRAVALVQLGEIYEDRLKRDDAAEEAYGRALALAAVGRSAHAALGRFRTVVRRRDAAALADSLGQLAGALGDESPAARAAVADERALAARWAGEAEGALELLREAAAVDATAISPWLARARLSAGVEKELAEALDGLGTRAGDPLLAAALARRAGVLALGTADEALTIPRLCQAQALRPGDPSVTIPLCEQVADPDALAARIQLADADTRVEWMVERGERLEELGRIGEAAREAERALELDGRHLGALELARRLAKTGGDELGYARATARLAGELQESERAAMLLAEAGAGFEKAGQIEPAAAAFRGVLDRTPLDGDAYNRARSLLAALHAERHDPGPLVELLTYRLEHVQDVADRTQLWLDRAELLVNEGDRDGAERDLRAALEAVPDHLAAMRRLAELIGQAPAGRAEAVSLWERYLELERDPERRRAALLRLVDLEESPGGDGEAAIRYLEAAIDLSPSPLRAVAEHERLASLLSKQRHWQRAVEALRRLSDISGAGSARAAVELRIADIYRDGFADTRASVEAILRALRAEPLELEALRRLVGYAESGHVVPLELEERIERAVEKARAQTAAEPGRADAYQALTRLWGWRADEDARVLAAQAHAILTGQPAPAREGGVDPAKELSPAGWERVLPETARTVALDVWRIAVEATTKLYGPSLESLGVGKAQRVGGRNMPVAWLPVDKIARALGCGPYELYTAPQADVCTVAGNALVCGAAFADKLKPPTRFRVTRQLVLLRDRLGPLERIEDEDLIVLFAALARCAEVPRPRSVSFEGLDGRIDDRAKTLTKLLGRKERKALTALGPRFGDLPEPPVWRQAVLSGAARVGLVVNGDLDAALRELGLAQRDRHARELMAFSVSEEYLALRRELGLRA
jgi:tetratricopeptide (TPR) repeat protein